MRSFQLAWIDAAFGPVSDRRLAELDQEGSSEDQRELFGILLVRVRDRQADEFLAGRPADWDIEALKGQPGASERNWWENRGDLAIATGQWGLAEACFATFVGWSPKEENP